MQTLLLAKTLGVFLIVIGAAIMLRRNHFIAVFAEFPQQRLVRTVTAMAELLAGLFLAIGYNDWSSLPAGIVTLIGWLAIAEGALYLLLPDAHVKRFIDTFNTPVWYIVGGVLAVAIGAYLANYGFALLR